MKYRGEKKKKRHSLNSEALLKTKAMLFINTMTVQIRSSNLHSASKSDFEIRDGMRLQGISGGNTY